MLLATKNLAEPCPRLQYDGWRPIHHQELLPCVWYFPDFDVDMILIINSSDVGSAELFGAKVLLTENNL